MKFVVKYLNLKISFNLLYFEHTRIRQLRILLHISIQIQCGEVNFSSRNRHSVKIHTSISTRGCFRIVQNVKNKLNCKRPATEAYFLEPRVQLLKGQLISKCLFGFFNSSKKQKKSAPVGQGKNLNFQVCFLEELKTPKRHFEIN